MSVSARFYIRFRIQRQIGIDDGFVLFGTGCLITAMALLFKYINKMYMAEALLFGVPNAELSSNFIEDSYWYHKISAVALIMTWCSLVSVKFCFLFLFRKILNRTKSMLTY